MTVRQPPGVAIRPERFAATVGVPIHPRPKEVTMSNPSWPWAAARPVAAPAAPEAEPDAGSSPSAETASAPLVVVAAEPASLESVPATSTAVVETAGETDLTAEPEVAASPPIVEDHEPTVVPERAGDTPTEDGTAADAATTLSMPRLLAAAVCAIAMTQSVPLGVVCIGMSVLAFGRPTFSWPSLRPPRTLVRIGVGTLVAASASLAAAFVLGRVAPSTPIAGADESASSSLAAAIEAGVAHHARFGTFEGLDIKGLQIVTGRNVLVVTSPPGGRCLWAAIAPGSDGKVRVDASGARCTKERIETLRLEVAQTGV